MNAKTMFGILTSLVMLAGTACGAADGTSAEADTSVQEDTLSAKTFTADSSNVKLLGRDYLADDGTLWVVHSASGVEFSFMGTKASVTIVGDSGAGTAQNSGNEARFAVYVNGKLTMDELVTEPEKTYEIFSSDAEAETVVRIIKLSESANSTFGIKSIDAECTGGIQPTAPKDMKIEFIGDSITCGYGVLAEPTVTGYTTFEQDSTMAYAYMTAEKLNASGRYEAISGQGILCNCNGEKALEITKFYRWTLRDETPWDFSLWTPDVVVVNAGTNDSWGGVDSAAFGAKADEFLRELREVYPDALLIWAYGMMDVRFTDTLTAVVAALGDERVRFLPLAPIDLKNGDVGGGGHPNVNASIRVSDLLAKTIKNELGW